MIKTTLAVLFALALAVCGGALAAIVEPQGQDSGLANLFALTQVVILGGVGAMFLGDWASALQDSLARTKEKRRTNARRGSFKNPS